MSINFFYGDEDYNIELKLEEMKSKLNQDFIAMNYQVLDNPAYTDLITALRTPPMMFGDMLIVINADKYFFSQKNFFEGKYTGCTVESGVEIPDFIKLGNAFGFKTTKNRVSKI